MAEDLAQKIKRCFMRFRDRAERADAQQIVSTFVSVGPLLDVLSSDNNQLVYGRRGTGKTHALLFLASEARKAGDISIYIDCQNIGSNQSIYDDRSLPIAERATRLLIDVCSAFHLALLDVFSDPKQGWDLSAAGPLLDSLVTAISEVRVVGPVEVEVGSKQEEKRLRAFTATAAISTAASVGADLKAERNASTSVDERTKRQGTESAWINFNYLNQVIRDLLLFLKGKRIWIMLDEWSTIPIDVQPYCADLVKRLFFTVPSISVKIAAIEHRSAFKLD